MVLSIFAKELYVSALYPQKFMKKQHLNFCPHIVLNKVKMLNFSILFFLIVVLKAAFHRTQFHISNTSDGGVSGENCNFLEEY